MIGHRLDADHLTEWWSEYRAARKSFVEGFIGRIEAIDALRNLRYRDDALRIEILEWEKSRIRLLDIKASERKAQYNEARRNRYYDRKKKNDP